MRDGIVSVQQHMAPTKVIHNLQLKVNTAIYNLNLQTLDQSV
jgi:hypothetical protein